MKILLLTSLFFTSIIIANDQIPEINPKLINGKYSFTGKVTTEMGTHSFIHTFKGRTTQKTFECSWEQDAGPTKMTGSVKTDGNSGVLKLQDMKEQKSTARIAIAGATGVSGSSAHFMYAMWKGNSSDIFPDVNIRVIQKENLTFISGDKGPHFLTIIMKKGNITSIESVYDPAKNKIERQAELTDDQIKEVLKSTNKEITDKSISEMKEMLKEANKSLSQLQDKMTTKLVFTVVY